MMGIYLVTSGCDRHTVEVAKAAAKGGAGMIQVRAKNLPDRQVLELVRQVGQGVQALNLPKPPTLVVDDAVAVAWMAMREGLCDGVHVGQDDLPVRAVRKILGPDAVIGLTTGTLQLVQAANQDADVLDYLGAGPFRPTPTKDSGRNPIGVDGYRDLVAATELPITAIGDIQLADVAALAATGVDGVAVVRSVMQATNPEDMVRRMVAEFERGKTVLGKSSENQEMQ